MKSRAKTSAPAKAVGPKMRGAAAARALPTVPPKATAIDVRRIATAPEILTLPSAQNERVLQAWGRLGDVDLSAIADKLREKSKAVIEGDTTTVEALLFDTSICACPTARGPGPR